MDEQQNQGEELQRTNQPDSNDIYRTDNNRATNDNLGENRYSGSNNYQNSGYYSGPNDYEPVYSEVTGESDGIAVAILILGIASIICSCLPCGIIALVLRSMHKDKISPEKQGLVMAGFVTSIIGIVLFGISLFVWIFAMFIYGMSMF